MKGNGAAISSLCNNNIQLGHVYVESSWISFKMYIREQVGVTSMSPTVTTSSALPCLVRSPRGPVYR